MRQRLPRDLQPRMLLTAYANGIFPMANENGRIGWYCPDPRAIIPLDTFHVPRTLAALIRQERFEVRIDADFAGVMHRCANRVDGEPTWISDDIVAAYCRLHELGFAHSVETYLDGSLAGGLYGVAIGGAFMGESMFHTVRDASKVALVHLVQRMRQRGFVLLDTQFVTSHLRRFGAVVIPRNEYLSRLEHALTCECTFV